jgi:hypothetical protein
MSAEPAAEQPRRLRYMGGSRRVQGVSTPFRPKVPFFVEECNFQTVHCPTPKFSPEKALVHCTKPKIFPRKKLFFATRKDVESYSQMPGKRILAPEFLNSDHVGV